MRPSSRLPRAPVRLSEAVHRQLSLYALAANAAGVTALALALPSEAKVVYTKTHKIIRTDGLYPLDLNHDGTIDFLIQEQGYPTSSSGNNGLGAKGAFGNPVEGSNRLASALHKSAPIGPRQHFTSSTGTFGAIMFNAACSVDSGCSIVGKWNNVKNRYLGVRFQIDGKTHYGWARFSVEVQKPRYVITATLTGYAYETTQKKEIRAGQIHDADANLAPASLGRLARGAQTAPAMRKP